MSASNSLKPAQAGFYVPSGSSDSALLRQRATLADIQPSEILVRMRRPNGLTCLLRVDGQHFDELMARSNAEFGDSLVSLGGPVLVDKKR